MHRRAGGRGSGRAGTACIPFSNPLSRGSLRAASCALSFASLCHSYMCARLFRGNSRGDYFLGCKRSVFISNDRRRRGEEKKERKRQQGRSNVQETLLQIQIPLGFHSSESLRWCLRRLTSHFRVGGGVGAGAGVHPLAPFRDRSAELRVWRRWPLPPLLGGHRGR